MSLLIAPIEALTDSLLSDSELKVLLALYSFKNKDSETVWPSIELIAARARINDVPRISKLTKSLAEKGWLTKVKKFHGGNEYTLMVPERLKGAEIELVEDTNLANSTKLVKDTNTNLANSTKSNLAKFTNSKEQSTEQTIEQSSIKKNKQKKSDSLDFSVWPSHSEKLRQAWQKIPKRKAAGITQPVIDEFAVHFRQAEQNGFTTDQCLTVCVTEGWRGFRWVWLKNLIERGQGNAENKYSGNQRGNNQAGLAHDDTSWADELFGTEPPPSYRPDQQAVQVIEGNFSRVVSSDQRP